MRTVICPDPTCVINENGEKAMVEVSDNVQVGDVLTCNNCFSDMEVLSVEPEVRVELIVESK